jgi:hypothetical protein
MGPAAVRAANIIAPELLLFTFSELARKHYKDLVVQKPKNVQFYRGWINRVNEWQAA